MISSKKQKQHPLKKWLKSQIDIDKLTYEDWDGVLDKVMKNPLKFYSIIFKLKNQLHS